MPLQHDAPVIRGQNVFLWVKSTSILALPCSYPTSNHTYEPIKSTSLAMPYSCGFYIYIEVSKNRGMVKIMEHPIEMDGGTIVFGNTDIDYNNWAAAV